MEVTSLVAIAIAIAIAIARHVVATVVVATLRRLPASPTEIEGKGCYDEISGENLALRAAQAFLCDISWPRPEARVPPRDANCSLLGESCDTGFESKWENDRIERDHLLQLREHSMASCPGSSRTLKITK